MLNYNVISYTEGAPSRVPQILNFLPPPEAAVSAEAVPNGAPRVPQFLFYHIFWAETPPKASVSQMGADGATPPEGEGNPTECGYFASDK